MEGGGSEKGEGLFTKVDRNKASKLMDSLRRKERTTR